MSLRNYLCKWPDRSVTVLQAYSLEEALELLDEISGVGNLVV
jgi:hypothetical protein